MWPDPRHLETRTVQRRIRLASCLTLAMGLATAAAGDGSGPRVDDEGSVHAPAYVLPESPLLGAGTRAVLKRERDNGRQEAVAPRPCPSMKGADPAQVPAIRQCEADAFYRTAGYRHLRELYRVTMTPQRIGGVDTEVFEPADGIEPRNAKRVLINLHGGAFHCCARTESHTESVPIAAVGRIRVVSVDYRQAPEHVFPAASEDVEAVYRELLKTYPPSRIGIFGCSAGGLLTAQSVARFQKAGLPLPGAIGMLCEGADYWTDGDSGNLAVANGWWDAGDTIGANAYFRGTDPDDPLAFPARSARVIAKFPPSLLVAGTRDVALSSVVHTHQLLLAQGVDAELHVWEGLAHAFFNDPDLPESVQVYAVVARFFDTHLGR